MRNEKASYIFRHLKGKTSCGIDNIPNIVLKNMPIKTINSFCTLSNNMLNNSYFPKYCREAKVIAIPKKDRDNSNPNK